jgi:hypothetical protein
LPVSHGIQEASAEETECAGEARTAAQLHRQENNESVQKINEKERSKACVLALVFV